MRALVTLIGTALLLSTSLAQATATARALTESEVETQETNWKGYLYGNYSCQVQGIPASIQSAMNHVDMLIKNSSAGEMTDSSVTLTSRYQSASNAFDTTTTQIIFKTIANGQQVATSFTSLFQRTIDVAPTCFAGICYQNKPNPAIEEISASCVLN